MRYLGRYITYALRFQFRILAGGYLLTFSLFLLLLNATIQEFVGQQVALWLSNSLKTTVKIEGFRFRPMHRVVIDQLYIEDHYGDTLLVAEEVSIRLGSLRVLRQQIDISSITLGRLEMRLQRKAFEETFNFQFLADFFAGAETDTTTALPLKFRLGALQVKDGKLLFHDDTQPLVGAGFDPARFELAALQLQLDSIFVSTDSSSLWLQNLRFAESRGLKVREGRLHMALLPHALVFDRLGLKSSDSQIKGNLRFDFEESSELTDWKDKLRLRAQLDRLHLGQRDLYWLLGPRAPLSGVRVRGELSGKLGQLRGRNLEMHLGDAATVRGNLFISGLPRIHEAYFDLQLKEVYAQRAGLEMAFPGLVWPEELRGLDFLRIQGEVKGVQNNFKAKGLAASNLGDLSTDIHLQTLGKQTRFAGELALFDLHLGTLTGDSSLGKVQLQTRVKGSGSSWQDLVSKLNGNIDYFDYQGYRYHDVEVDGYLDKKSFSGKIGSVDSNAAFSFFGLADFRPKVPFFNFVAEVDRIDLHALGWSKDTVVFRGFAEICAEGSNADNVLGELNLREMDVRFNSQQLDVSEVKLLVGADDDYPQRIQLYTPFGNAFVVGDFERTQLPSLMRHYVHHYVQRQNQSLTEPDSNQYFELNLDIGKAQWIADLLAPGQFDIDYIKGHVYFNATRNEADVDIHLPALRMGNLRMSGLQLSANSDDDSLFVDFYADSLWAASALLAQQISLEHYLSNDTLGFNFRAIGEGVYNDLQLDGYIDFAEEVPGLQFLPSSIKVYDNEWKLAQNGIIRFKPEYINIPDLQLRQGQQFVALRGQLGNALSDTLSLRLDDVDLQQLNPLLKVYNTSMEGYANVDLQANAVTGSSAVFGNIHLSELVVDGLPLGDLTMESVYNLQAGSADLHAELVLENDTLLYLFGSLGDSVRRDVVNLEARLSHSPIRPLEHLLRPTFTDISGKASARLFARGTWRDLDLTGEVDLEGARTRVDVLNQYYNIHKKVLFTTGNISFEQADITDDTGGRGKLNGRITHEYFRKTRLDLQLDARNLLVLNTEPNFTDAYFGVGRLTGRATFTGPIDLVDIQIRAATERGTRFAIPLDAESNRANLDFINFINAADTVVNAEDEKRFETTGINFGMNVTANPDAEFSILFDRVAGDIIRGRGNGAVEFLMNPQGEINMFGNYTFSSGDYSFTLANVPSKRFRITEGSTIAWTGDPYDAQINLTAVYRQRASIIPLLTEGQLTAELASGKARTHMNVDTYLKITGSLLKPTINFEIKLPTANENDASDLLVARIQNINNNEQELNNQVLALLVAGQFLPSDNQIATSFLGSTGANSLTEVLSNQLNAVLSQMIDNVNIGINYRSSNLGTVTDVTRNDITVALNTTLFNDRVRIDGNVGNTLRPGIGNSATAQNLAGEVIVEYLITPDGNFRVKAFNKLDDRVIVNRESNYRQGVGISYTENYNNLQELLQKPKRYFQDRLFRRIPWLPEKWKGDF
ncbi:MAG: hypothetical protein C0424_05065 [Sphingobacteriaceae bacterium]|nr:hypothetical protein [Sphingobacteriaceae bacterium]